MRSTRRFRDTKPRAQSAGSRDQTLCSNFVRELLQHCSILPCRRRHPSLHHIRTVTLLSLTLTPMHFPLSIAMVDGGITQLRHCNDSASIYNSDRDINRLTYKVDDEMTQL